MCIHLQFDLGRRGACGDGEEIGDVSLPPWASSTHEFVHMHREVLHMRVVHINWNSNDRKKKIWKFFARLLKASMYLSIFTTGLT